jgi:hypothetical protein
MHLDLKYQSSSTYGSKDIVQVNEVLSIILLKLGKYEIVVLN